MDRLETQGAKRNIDILAALALLACLVLLLWKAPFGYVSADESFYLTVPYRLCQGDALLVDEWHPSQLSGVLLYPALRLYLALSGSTEGIYLSFRYIYAVAQILAAAYIYLRLRRISPLAALAAALIFVPYAPLNIAALSYNSMGLMLFSAVCVTLATTRGGRKDAALSGLLFAGAVLCNPYLMALYAIYCLAALLGRRREGCLAPRFWLLFTVGAALVAAALLGLVLSRGSISEVLATLPWIMNDPEHQSVTLGYRLFKYAESLYGNAWRPEITWAWLLLALVLALDKGRTRHRALYIIPVLLCAALYYSFYFVRFPATPNYLMYPLALLGGFSFFLGRERDKRPFLLMYLPGLAYSLCMHFASNLGMISIGTAMTVCALASCYYILRLARELWADGAVGAGLIRRLLAAALAAVLLCQAGVLFFLRTTKTFWDGEVQALDCVIDAGPQKGIRTTERYFDHANRLMKSTAPVRDTEQEYVAYFSNDSWLYLMDDSRMGSFSGWIPAIRLEAVTARLASYWEAHPERRPERLFINAGLLDESTVMSILGIEDWPVTKTASGYIVAAP